MAMKASKTVAFLSLVLGLCFISAHSHGPLIGHSHDKDHSGASNESDEGFWKQKLLQLKEEMKTDDVSGMDPMKIASFSHNFTRLSDSGSMINLMTSPMVVSGVSGFVLREIKTESKGVLKFNLFLPQIKCDGSYQMMEIHPNSANEISGNMTLKGMDIELTFETITNGDETRNNFKLKSSIQSDSVASDFDSHSGRPFAALTPVDAKDRLDSIGKAAFELIFREIVEKLKVYIEKEFRQAIDNLEPMILHPTPYNSSVEGINRYVDDLLKRKRKALEKKIGHVVLPEKKIDFEKKIIMVTTHGYVQLSNGFLNNFHTIYRREDCVLYTSNDVLHFAVNLGAHDVRGGYDIHAEFGVFGITANLKIQLTFVGVKVVGRQSFKSMENNGNLLNLDSKLHIEADIGKIIIKVDSLGPLDWVINFIANKVVASIRTTIQNKLKQPWRDLIEQINGDFGFK